MDNCSIAYDHPYLQEPCEGCGFNGYKFESKDTGLKETIKWLNSLCCGVNNVYK